MTTTARPLPLPDRTPASDAPLVGPIGRLGAWTVRHARLVLILWAVVAIGLGALAPRVETALSGAGWEASGSESVAARELIQKNFAGASSSALMVVVHSPDKSLSDPEFAGTVTRVEKVLRTSGDVASISSPAPGVSISRDGHTAIVMAGAKGSTTQMVAVAEHLKDPIARAGASGVRADLTGSSGMWSDFNTANRTAMMKSEMYSWPVTLVILLLAFGSLVAAGLPLMLTIIGLASSAGLLYLASHVSDVSIWAMNFALMFALALGIDYALFVVHRFRGELFGARRSPEHAVATTMDSAGKAVLFSGITVLVSLTAVMLVPSPAFRSMALGIMLSVAFVLAATLTLLPIVLAKLGTRVDALSLPWVHAGEHRSPRFERWAERLWRHPVRYGATALAVLVALAIPVLGLRTGMPSIKVVPPTDHSRVGYTAVQEAFGKGAPGALQIVTRSDTAAKATTVLESDRGIARVMPSSASRCCSTRSSSASF